MKAICQNSILSFERLPVAPISNIWMLSFNWSQPTCNCSPSVVSHNIFAPLVGLVFPEDDLKSDWNSVVMVVDIFECLALLNSVVGKASVDMMLNSSPFVDSMESSLVGDFDCFEIDELECFYDLLFGDKVIVDTSILFNKIY